MLYNKFIFLERSDDTMKVYDKEIYNKQENIRMTIILVIVFLIGFFAGYYAHSLKNSEKNNQEETNNTVLQVKNE